MNEGRGTHSRQSCNLVPELLQQHRKLIQREAVIPIRVVQIKQLPDLLELVARHRDHLLDAFHYTCRDRRRESREKYKIKEDRRRLAPPKVLEQKSM